MKASASKRNSVLRFAQFGAGRIGCIHAGNLASVLDAALADRPENAVINAVDPDVSKFAAAGGKLILTGGWANALTGSPVAGLGVLAIVIALGWMKWKRRRG